MVLENSQISINGGGVRRYMKNRKNVLKFDIYSVFYCWILSFHVVYALFLSHMSYMRYFSLTCRICVISLSHVVCALFLSHTAFFFVLAREIDVMINNRRGGGGCGGRQLLITLEYAVIFIKAFSFNRKKDFFYWNMINSMSSCWVFTKPVPSRLQIMRCM